MEKNKDILVEEIRARANNHWKKYEFNIKKIAKAIKDNEKKNRHQIVNVKDLNKELQKTTKN